MRSQTGRLESDHCPWQDVVFSEIIKSYFSGMEDGKA